MKSFSKLAIAVVAVAILGTAVETADARWGSYRVVTNYSIPSAPAYMPYTYTQRVVVRGRPVYGYAYPAYPVVTAGYFPSPGVILPTAPAAYAAPAPYAVPTTTYYSPYAYPGVRYYAPAPVYIVP